MAQPRTYTITLYPAERCAGFGIATHFGSLLTPPPPDATLTTTTLNDVLVKARQIAEALGTPCRAIVRVTDGRKPPGFDHAVQNLYYNLPPPEQAPSAAHPHSPDLATCFADPYHPLDTTGANPRLHAYRRIALAARALQYDLEGVTQAALMTLGQPLTENGNAAGTIDDLSLEQVQRVADHLELRIDHRLYG